MLGCDRGCRYNARVPTEPTPQQAVWAKLYERFDPEKPAFKREWRVERKYSPAKEIAAQLARPIGGPKRFMVLGGIGSGKSTELYGIAEQRATTGPVAFVDLVEHFEQRVADGPALERVQAWEVLLLIGLAVFEAGSKLGHRWSKLLHDDLEAAGREFVEDEAEKPTFDVGKLASTLVVLVGGAIGGAVAGPVGLGLGAGLVAAGEAGKSMQWRFKIGVPGRRDASDQEPRVQRLLDAVNTLIGDLQSTHECRLTIFVDGLDRIRDVARARSLFIDSALLGNVECDIVVTGPLVLHWQSLRKHVRHFSTRMLTNAPVLDRNDPWDWQHPGSGVDLCVDVFGRRVTDLPADLVPAPLVRKLAFYSGGRMREFVRLIRELCGPAWDRSLDRADETIVDQAIDELRHQTEGGLTRKHLDILRALIANPTELPDDDKVPAMLDVCLILPYPNESEWYFPHPLLLKVKLPKPG